MSIRAAAVSRELNKNFTRSTSSPSRIKGWPNISPGFHVTQINESSVAVRWRGERGSGSLDRSAERQDEMMAYLRELGYVIEKPNEFTHWGFRVVGK